MESTKDIYKTGALLSAKRVLEQEREKYIRKQIYSNYPAQDEKVLEQLINKKVIESKLEVPLIDVTNINKVKTLDEFINEAIEKDRQEVIEIGESLSSLIQNAPEEDVVELENKNQTVEDFANEVIKEDDEKDDFEKILESVEDKETIYESEEKNKEQGFIEPKYFIIEIGNEENSKQIVVDIEGKPVGKIENNKFEMNEEYINSKLEEYNIDDYISTKVPNIEEQQRIKQELKPKTLEQLSEIDFESGKDIVKKIDKIIEEPEEDLEPKEDEKSVKDEIDDKTLEEDEEKRKQTIEELDEISKEKDGEKMEDFLDKNSSRKLTILRPYTLTDQLPNHELKEKGEPITVYQLKGTIKPVFVLKQGDRVLYGDRYNEQIGKNMERVPYTSGVVKEVSDEKTSAEVTLADGTEKEFLIKGEPRDIDVNDKNAIIAKLDELNGELKRIMEITPDDIIDYKIEFPGGPEQKCQRIDEIEMAMYKVCAEYGIVPPVEVKTEASNEKEPEELPENDGEEVEDEGWIRTRYNGEPSDPRKPFIN